MLCKPSYFSLEIIHKSFCQWTYIELVESCLKFNKSQMPLTSMPSLTKGDRLESAWNVNLEAQSKLDLDPFLFIYTCVLIHNLPFRAYSRILIGFVSCYRMNIAMSMMGP